MPYKTVVSLAAVVAIFGCYVAGLSSRLFGPSIGNWLSLLAFVGGVVALIVLDDQRRRGTLRPLAEFRPAVARTRSAVSAAIGLCAVTFGVMFVAARLAERGDGVAGSLGPVFAVRSEYQLCAHGVYTTVTRARYVTVGTGDAVAWHAFGILFTLLALDPVLYGNAPPGPRRESGTDEKAGRESGAR